MIFKERFKMHGNYEDSSCHLFAFHKTCLSGRISNSIHRHLVTVPDSPVYYTKITNQALNILALYCKGLNRADRLIEGIQRSKDSNKY